MKNEKIKVLIGNDTVNQGIRLASHLTERGLFAFTRKEDDKIVFESVRNDKPDVVIVPLIFPDSDAIQLICDVRSSLENRPEFIVVSDMYNNFIEREVSEYGATLFIGNPDADKLAPIIRACAYKHNGFSSDELERIVTGFIMELGVPAHIKGYHYLRYAVVNLLFDDRLMDSITKQLYPFVADKYNTTSQNVERAIRNAIEIAWDRGETKGTINSYFCKSEDTYCRPTNSEFISLIIEKIKLQLKQ